MLECIFIRHARSVQRKDTGPSFWTISDQGRKEIITLAQEKDIQELDLLFSSAERKARLTTEGICRELLNKKTIPLMIDSQLNEVNHGTGIIFDDIEQLKYTVRKSLMNKDQSYNSWVPATSATLRITGFMDEQLENYVDRDSKIGIVSHGTIMSLYFGIIGRYYGQPEELYKHWESMPFGASEKIVDNKIFRELR